MHHLDCPPTCDGLCPTIPCVVRSYDAQAIPLVAKQENKGPDTLNEKSSLPSLQNEKLAPESIDEEIPSILNHTDRAEYDFMRYFDDFQDYYFDFEARRRGIPFKRILTMEEIQETEEKVLPKWREMKRLARNWRKSVKVWERRGSHPWRRREEFESLKSWGWAICFGVVTRYEICKNEREVKIARKMMKKWEGEGEGESERRGNNEKSATV